MKYLSIGILFCFVAISCEKEKPCSGQPKMVNDTINFGSSFEPTIYVLDLDSDGIEDGSIILNLQTSVGGNSCSIGFKVSDDNWAIAAKKIPVFICQDTLNWDLDPSVAYYKNYDCEVQENSIQVDTLLVVEVFQEGDLDIITENRSEEAFLYSYYGIGSKSIFPEAVFNEITSSVLENSNYSGWVVFEKNNSELYGIKVEIDANPFPCPSLYILQIKRIDCI